MMLLNYSQQNKTKGEPGTLLFLINAHQYIHKEEGGQFLQPRLCFTL